MYGSRHYYRIEPPKSISFLLDYLPKTQVRPPVPCLIYICNLSFGWLLLYSLIVLTGYGHNLRMRLRSICSYRHIFGSNFRWIRINLIHGLLSSFWKNHFWIENFVLSWISGWNLSIESVWRSSNLLWFFFEAWMRKL